MRDDAKTRIRKRIRRRLDDLDMTARELGQSMGHGDAWISGILKGRNGIDWKDYDQVADKLRMTPGELVCRDEDELHELTPDEVTWLRHYRAWPDTIRERLSAVFAFFAATAPDPDVSALIAVLKETPRSLRGPTIDWLRRLAREGIPREQLTGAVAPVTDGAHDGTGAKRRARRPETVYETRAPFHRS